MPFGLTTASTIYELQSVEEQSGEQVAVIVPETTVRIETSDTKEPSVKITNQECTGKILLNLTTGRPESSALKERLELTTTTEGDSASGTLVHTLSFESVSNAEEN